MLLQVFFVKNLAHLSYFLFLKGLFEFTTQQETIVQYCREAASRVFVFQDVLRSK